MSNVNNTMATMNVYLAKGESYRQTNGVPGGGKTFNWTERIASRSRSRRASRKVTI